MKNVFFFLSVLFVFSSCQNMEQYKAGIEELSSKWDATTTSATDFANSLNGEMSNFAQLAGTMEIAEPVFTSLSDEAKAKITEAKNAYTQTGGAFGAIQQEVTAFMAEWQTKGAEVTALKDGLAAGKLEGDVAAKLTELNTFVADAGTKMAAWSTSLESAKAAVAASHGNFSTVLASVMPAEDAKKK